MKSEPNEQHLQQGQESPANEDLQEPSTEKAPGQEPKAHEAGEPEPSHKAVGIGVIGGPLVDPERTSRGD
jgi:hypothetical protein